MGMSETCQCEGTTTRLGLVFLCAFHNMAYILGIKLDLEGYSLSVSHPIGVSTGL